MRSDAFQSTCQHTLASTVSCSGVGLHSGSNVNMTMHPAQPGTGIVFMRLDVEESRGTVHANYLNVCETTLGTTISNSYGTTVSTIEHLMAALWGMGVDNAFVVLDGAEVPIMDGSSEPFVFLIECAGVKRQKELREIIEVIRPLEVKDGDSYARISPFDGFRLEVEIDYSHHMLPCQKDVFDFTSNSFKQMLSRARTFGFEHDVDNLRSCGLARGGSLDNAVVIGSDDILNRGGLRYRDEFIRHKALDCVGDYYLAGAFIRASVVTSRPGHTINNKLMHALISDHTAWRMVSADRFAVGAETASKARVAHQQIMA